VKRLYLGCSVGFLFRSLLATFLVAVLTAVCIQKSAAQAVEPRLALVVGNAQYGAVQLATPANDAGLIAQTLQAAGFDVTGAADLDKDALQHVFKDFIDKVRKGPSGAIVLVYLAGRGVQFGGENYFLPIDATIQHASSVPAEALRLSDFTQALASLPLKARVFVLDAARANDYAKTGAPLAGGLALVGAEPGSLYALNAAPDTIAPDERGPYGIYAQALVEMMYQGFPVADIFAQTRLRVSQTSAGMVIPWDVSKIDAPFFFFQRQAGAPALQNRSDLNRALRDYPVQEAYAITLARDTMPVYQDFLAAYPGDPLAVRVRAILAARREALTWRQAFDVNSPQAYWTYMRRYPHGPHFADARRRLALLSQPLDPPPRFDPYDFVGLPPPPETEHNIVDRPVVVFDNPDYPPPPPPPVYILPERPVEFVNLPAPPQHELGVLPSPIPLEIPLSRSAGQRPGVINQPRFSHQAPGNITPREQGAPAFGQRPAEGPMPGEENHGKPPSEEHLEPGASPLPRPGFEQGHGGTVPGEPSGSDHALPAGAPSAVPQHSDSEQDHRGTPSADRATPAAPRAAPERALSPTPGTPPSDHAPATKPAPHATLTPVPPAPPTRPVATLRSAPHSKSPSHRASEHKPLPKKKSRAVRANSN
jgi:uncharacterized caspase-like protein